MRTIAELFRFPGPRSVVLILAAIISTASAATAQRLTVAPSGRATTEVALTPAEGSDAATRPLVVRIDYGQPHLRGRQLHTKDLVPYDEPWRLGANEPAMLRTDVDLVLGDATVPRGEYVLRAMPGKTTWRLLVEKVAAQPAMGAGQNAAPPEVVATVALKHSPLSAPLESFTMWLIPSTASGPPHGELRFAWGGTMLSTTWAAKP
jgi:hypothetical protein